MSDYKLPEKLLQDAQSLVHEQQFIKPNWKCRMMKFCRALIELDKSHFKYSDLLDFAPIGYFILVQLTTFRQVSDS